MFSIGDYVNTETQAVEPVVADVNPEAESVEADAKAPEAKGADSAPAGDSEPPVKPDLEKVQQRFDKLTREKHEYRLEAEYWRQKALQTQQPEPSQAKPQPVAPARIPQPEDYDYDTARHTAALEDYYSAKARAEVRAALDAERAAEREAERSRSFEQRQRAFLEQKPDYIEKVIRNDRLPISAEMAAVISYSEIGPEIAYYLADNVEKAEEIYRLDGIRAAREIGRIEAKLEAERKARTAPPASRVSQAPPPPPKIDAVEPAPSIRVDTPEGDKLSIKEWVKRREKQIERRRT